MCSPDRLRACFREPEMFDLTLLNEITHRASNLFSRYIRVNAVLIEQVDRVDADVLGAATQPLRLGVCLRPKVEAKLGCEDHLVPQRGKRFANKFFVHERTVYLSRVEKGDAKFDGSSKERNHLLFGRRDFSVASAHAHAP
jgi:hypothetical protein